MKQNALSRKISQVALFAALALYDLALVPPVKIGYYNDDAAYILAAKSLRSGRYVDLQVPGNPAAVDRLPGYPLLLTPFLFLAHSHGSWLPITSVAFSLACCALLWILSEGLFNHWLRFLWVAAVGFNPSFAKYSASVMSEPCYLFFLLLTLLLLKRALEEPSSWRFASMTLALAWALLIRPEGTALLVAVLGGLLYQRRWREAIGCGTAASFPLVLLMMRNLYLTQSPTGYAGQMAQAIAYFGRSPLALLKNAGLILDTLLTDTIWQGSLSVTQGLLITLARGAVAVGTAWLMGYGFSRIGRSMTKGLAVTCGLYVALHIGFHVIFPAANSRYFFCLLPFAFAGIISGFHAFTSGRQLARVWICGLLMSLVFLYGNPWTSPGDKILWRKMDYRLPEKTYAWIGQSTPATAFFLTTKPATLCLYTGRFAASELTAPDLETFRYLLLRNGITHILIAPARLLTLPTQRFQRMLLFWETAREWTRRWPDAFEPLYANVGEGTSVIQITPDAHYVEAFQHYAAADGAFANAQWSQGFHQLDLALAVYPAFPGALNAYGMALLQRRDLRGAQKKLEKAVALRPEFSFAWVNLAAVYRQEGNAIQTRTCLRKAQTALEIAPSWSGDAEDIRRRLDREIKLLALPPGEVL